MGGAFHLLDLPSQAIAVQRLLKGLALEEKLAWVAARGELTQIPISIPNARPCYRFISTIGMECMFFIAGDKIVFIGDHTTYTVGEDDPA